MSTSRLNTAVSVTSAPQAGQTLRHSLTDFSWLVLDLA